MLFNSYIFILLFLPLCLIGYYAINRTGRYRLGLAFLLGMSLWFYGYFNPWYLLLIGASILLNYGFYRLLLRCESKEQKSKVLLILGIALNLGILGYFKYTDFLIENINSLFHTSFNLRYILLPLGISFFTFQQLSFLIDTYSSIGGGYSFARIPFWNTRRISRFFHSLSRVRLSHMTF